MTIFYAFVFFFFLGGLTEQASASEVSVQDSVRKYRFLAKTSRDKKEYAEAIHYYEEYLKYKPDDVKAHFFLGELYFRTRNPLRARQVLREGLAIDSLHVNTNILLYNLYMRDEADPDSAAQCLERVLLVKPDDTAKRLSLADLYRRRGDVRKAIPHYEKLVDQVPDPEKLIELLSVLYEDLGETEQALEWRRRLMVGGDSAGLDEQRESLETMLRLQLETGDLKSAYQSLFQLAGIDSANRYSYYSRIATLAEQHGDPRMRLKGWEGMVQADPKDLETVASLVEWYLNESRIDSAQRWLKLGLNVEPQDAHLQILRGDILVLKKDEEGAIAAFEQARRDPRWERIAQQRIWQLRPPETEEEKLKKAFFGKGGKKEN